MHIVLIIFLLKYKILIVLFISWIINHDFLKELKICLHKLTIVDDTLEALGMSKKYQQLRNWIISIIIGWIVICFATNIFDSYLLTYQHFSVIRICIPFLGNYMIHVSNLNSVIWGAMVRSVYPC